MRKRCFCWQKSCLPHLPVFRILNLLTSNIFTLRILYSIWSDSSIFYTIAYFIVIWSLKTWEKMKMELSNSSTLVRVRNSKKICLKKETGNRKEYLTYAECYDFALVCRGSSFACFNACLCGDADLLCDWNEKQRNNKRSNADVVRNRNDICQWNWRCQKMYVF